MIAAVESWDSLMSRVGDELAALLAAPCDVAPLSPERASLADLRAELLDRGDFDGLDVDDAEGVL